MMSRRAFLASTAAAATCREGLAAPARASIVPIRSQSGRIGVDLTISGQGPFSFVLDTGGVASLIDHGLALKLGLRSQGGFTLGIGGHVGQHDLVTAPDVVVGGAFRTPAIQFAETNDVAFGEGFVGSLDAGFLTSSRSELLLDQSVWRIGVGPEEDFAGYDRIAGAIESKGPRGGSSYLFADVLIEGQRMRLGLDTGAPTTIRLSPSAARRAGFLSDGRRQMAVGRPGEKAAAAIRVKDVRMGKIDLGPQVVICAGVAGSSVFPDGLLGLKLLRLLDIATDPSSKALFIRRNGQKTIEDDRFRDL